MSLTVGGLFSGIGGWELGLERAGMTVAWHCEADPFCRKVLGHHWPDVPCFEDVRELRNPPYVDVLAGGFPCQDISLAGKGAGIEGSRSGLWSEFARLIGEVGPRYVLVENVSALRSRGLGRVLGDLAEIGYDAEWSCIRASDVGAPHRRERIWIVAYPNGQGLEGHGTERELCGVGGEIPTGRRSEWAAEPDVGRVAYGIPDRVDRLRSLGNALVPQAAEWIGQRIVAYEESGQNAP